MYNHSNCISWREQTVKVSGVWDSKIYWTLSDVLAFFSSLRGVAAFLMDSGPHLPRLGASKSFPIQDIDWQPLLSVIRYFPPTLPGMFVIYVPTEFETCFNVFESYDKDSFLCISVVFIT
jgi:hypothetical protein